MDYRIEIVDECPGSNPSGSYHEEFSADTEEAAVNEFNRRADELKKPDKQALRGCWRAHTLVRIDQREITTRIPVTLTRG